MRYFLIFFQIIFTAIVTEAQIVIIEDKTNKNLLEGVVLKSEKPLARAITNAYGEADISSFIDSDNIEIQYLGYETLFISYNQLQSLNYIIQLEAADLDLGEIIISATRWQQSSSQVPSKISTISAKEVAFQNPQTAADLLGISGKVFIQKSQQGGGSPMIRGFSANRLVYSVDGVRMNNAIFRSGNLQNVINLDPFSVENTEVLFGPGSVIYGSDAIGGVMSFKTFEPQLSLNSDVLVHGGANLRYSSANQEKTGNMNLNIGWKKVAIFTNFSHWSFDHLKQGTKGPDDYIRPYYVQNVDSSDQIIRQENDLLQIPSAYDQINFLQKVRFKPNEKIDIEYALHFSETSPYGRYDRNQRVRNNKPRYGAWNYGPQKWMMNLLTLGMKGHSFYDEASLKFAAQRFDESRITRNFNSSEETNRIEQVDAYSINIDLLKKLRNNNFSYGLEYVLNDVKSNGFNRNIFSLEKTDETDRYPQANWHSMALYVNDEIQLSTKTTVQAGMRYNYFLIDSDFSQNQALLNLPFSESNLEFGALTGSLGTVYKPIKPIELRTNFGTAFRSPNIDDIGKVFDSEGGSVVVPNPELRPEYAYNLDFGLGVIIAKKIKIEINPFYTILQNAMVRRDYKLNGLDSIIYDGTLSQVQAIQNAASSYVYGIQFGTEVKLYPNITFLTDLNFQKGEEELDDGTTSASRHAAPFFGVSRLRFQNSLIILEFNSIYQGEIDHNNLSLSERGKDEIYALDANGNTYAPSWVTLNIKAQFKINPNISLGGGIENITDQRYRPYSSGLSGAGRNFYFSINSRL